MAVPMEIVVVLNLACHGSIISYVPLTASEDIETRICSDETSSIEDVLVRELQM